MRRLNWLNLCLALSLTCYAVACSPEPINESGVVIEPGEIATPDLESAIEASIAAGTYRPSEAAKNATAPTAAEFGQRKGALVSQQGEIVVLTGDQFTVSDLGDNSFGLVLNNQVQNPMAVAQEFFKTYPDEFDAITVFTTFPDGGSAGSVAWYLGIRAHEKGIGVNQIDNGNFWGSVNGGKLAGFINMQYVGKYGQGMENPNHTIHPVMAQEFGHRWGSFLKYVDGNGEISDRMLGRDAAHWASTMQANGSVMDGNHWVDNGDGTFRVEGNNYRWSELDQYIMGLRAPDEVPPWYVINGATYKGQGINPAAPLPHGIQITGSREDITVEQVVEAHGPRVPSHIEAPKDFRIAIVLVTRPNEDPTQLGSFIKNLEGFRAAFEQVANQMSDGRMRICTQVSAPCDSAGAALEDVIILEQEGNGDGVLDPGETAAIRFSVKSTGFGDAPDVKVEVGTPNLPSLNVLVQQVSLGDIPEGEVKMAPEPLLLKIPPSVECGARAIVPLKLYTDGRTFHGEIQFDIGVRTIVFDGMDAPDTWTMNPYNTDTVVAGAFEIGEPAGVDGLYLGVNLVTQPAQDHSAEGVNALVTGRGAGQVGENDVDDGTTTALSPEYDISKARDPLLSFYTWRFAYDFNGPEGVVPMTEDDALYVEASADGGKTWTILVEDFSNEQAWIHHKLRLSEHVELTGSLQLRVTMSDGGTQTLNEALVDDILIWDEADICVMEEPTDGDDTTGADGGTGTDEAGTDGTSDTTGDGETGGDVNATTTGNVELDAGKGEDGCSAGSAPNPATWILFAQLLVMLGILRRRFKSPKAE